eukprot:s42_g28.t1
MAINMAEMELLYVTSRIWHLHNGEFLIAQWSAELVVAAMALAAALAAICPPGSDDFCDQNEMITLITTDGHALRCLDGLLRARCPKGPQAAAGEELSVVLPLLQWVYAARVQDRPLTSGDGDIEHFARIVRLAERWGLRDVGELQERIMAKRSRARGAGTLPEDLLTAYRNNALKGRFSFRCPAWPNKGDTLDDEDMEVPLEGGLTALLQLRSEYFRAMLSGAWAERLALQIKLSSFIDETPLRRREIRKAFALKLSVAPSQLQFLTTATNFEELGDDEVQVCVQADPLEDAFVQHLNLLDFQEVATLRSLELSDWRHPRLPEHIGEIAHLKSIVIKNSDLELLPPPRIFSPILQVLYIERTKISVLPSLHDLKTLQVLQVRSTKLEEVPSLPDSLEFLQLERCSLRRMSNLMGCCQLKRLSLDGNYLTELPDFPVSLEKISLQHNRLRYLPGSLTKLQNLQGLFLTDNCLMELPADIGQLKNLKELHLESNKLRSIPDSFGNLTELQKLDLERNPIRQLPETCANIQKLEELYIDADKLDEWPNEHWRNVNVVRFVFGLLTLLLNLWLQLFILWNVNHYIVQNAVHDAQENYARFHHEVFDKDGVFSQEKWDNWNNGPYMELCNMAVSKLSFSAGIVFLWSARMLNEVRDSWHLAHDLFAIESLPLGAKPHDMLHEVKDDSGETLRVEIVAVNGMARIIVAMLLTYIGCRWLAATQSFGDLILNALALEFVIGIDDLMYEAFTPLDVRQFIEQTKSTVLLVGILIWAFVYLNYLQQVLPNFPHDIREHCSDRFYSHYKELCCPTRDEKTVVTMYWPRDQMARLLEFIHGGTFVAKAEDLRIAVDCASFFGVPSLLHHVREWIANNLKVSTAPTLWRFVETEPLLKMQDIDCCEDAEDVEAACFEFHLEHFSELAGIKVWESFGGDDETNDASEEDLDWHCMCIELFHRLLMSGLVRLPTRQLICVVERFARAKCSDPSCTEAFAKLFTSLMPPAVIFNRDCRSALLQFNDVPARTMITV